MTQTRARISTVAITRIAIMAAISAFLYFFPEVPVVGFYKLDFSNLPSLLCGFALGPWAGLATVFIKDLVGMTHSTSMFVGELADFLCSGAFIVCASAWYRRHKTFKGALAGMALGTLAIVVMGAIANYYIMIPFYVQVMHLPEEAVIGMIAKVIPAVDSIPRLIAFATVPFNALKGVVISGLTLVLYKRLSGFLHGAK